MLPRRIVVLANPAAGFRRTGDPGHRVVEAIRASGRRVELARTGGPGDAERLAREAVRSETDLLIVVGGDGTLHEVANAAAGTATRVGIAPTGTMNLVARVLRTPLDPVAAALRAVERTRVLRIHPGRAGDRLFVAMAGIGFDAWVLRSLLARGRKIGFRDYTIGALRALGSYPFPRIEFEHEAGRACGRMGVLGRVPLYGGFLRPTPRVRIDGEELELCVIDVDGVLSALRIAPALWSGSHLDRPEVADRMVRQVRVRSDHADVPVQLDGEPCGELPRDFGVSDRVLLLAH